MNWLSFNNLQIVKHLSQQSVKMYCLFHFLLYNHTIGILRLNLSDLRVHLRVAALAIYLIIENRVQGDVLSPGGERRQPWKQRR